MKALGGDPAAWNSRWITAGLEALEALLSARPGPFVFGSEPGMAECYLIPMAYSARRFGVELDSHPHLSAILSLAEAHPAIAAAHPDLQPDARR